MKENIEIRECTRCVMDNSLYQLTFNQDGQCDACEIAFSKLKTEIRTDKNGKLELEKIISKLKEEGKNKPYDALIGLSGGVDSSYLAHLCVKEFDLRVVALHVDAGWNTTPAVKNIYRLVDKLNIDLFTFIIEWEEMRDLQRAFILSGVQNQDIPQDHAFMSNVYRFAAKHNINYFISGINFATENVNPLKGISHPFDSIHINAIQKEFGSKKLSKFRIMSLFEWIIKTKIQKRPQILCPLNFTDYNKKVARELLESQYNWTSYGEKHCESRFTKFYQEQYLPEKYGFDKRRLHLSSMIVAGHISRQEAIKELSKPIVSDRVKAKDFKFIAKKLQFCESELKELFQKRVDHLQYKNIRWLFEYFVALKNKFSKIKFYIVMVSKSLFK